MNEMNESDEMIVIYEAGTYAEAQMLSDRLSAADINNHVANVSSPFDGLIAGEQTIPVRVLAQDAEQAREIVDAFLDEQGS